MKKMTSPKGTIFYSLSSFFFFFPHPQQQHCRRCHCVTAVVVIVMIIRIHFSMTIRTTHNTSTHPILCLYLFLLYLYPKTTQFTLLPVSPVNKSIVILQSQNYMPGKRIKLEYVMFFLVFPYEHCHKVKEVDDDDVDIL